MNILHDLNCAIGGLCQSQGELATILKKPLPEPPRPQNGGVPRGREPQFSKKPRNAPPPPPFRPESDMDTDTESVAQPGHLGGSLLWNPPNSNFPPEKVPVTTEDKFREAIREAERSTILFDLDLGRTPIMNQETISKRATLALASMAATVEQTSKPSPRLLKQLMTYLVCAQNIPYLGKLQKLPATQKNRQKALSVRFQSDMILKTNKPELKLNNRCTQPAKLTVPPPTPPPSLWSVSNRLLPAVKRPNRAIL